MKLRELKDRWCLRMTVYRPEPGPGVGTHSSIGTEGPISAGLGEFLEILGPMMGYLDRDDIAALVRITEKLRRAR